MDSATCRAAIAYVAPSRHALIHGPTSRTHSRAASNTANSMPGSYVRMVNMPSLSSVRILGIEHSLIRVRRAQRYSNLLAPGHKQAIPRRSPGVHHDAARQLGYTPFENRGPTSHTDHDSEVRRVIHSVETCGATSSRRFPSDPLITQLHHLSCASPRR